MITYKYKLYRTDKTKHFDAMLREACFVWNHALALQNTAEDDRKVNAYIRDNYDSLARRVGYKGRKLKF